MRCVRISVGPTFFLKFNNSDCGDDGNIYEPHGNQFSLDCPAGCDKVTPTRVYGSAQYTLESSICQAAIHDGRTTGDHGGSITMRIVAGEKSGYKGSENHGIISNDADPADKSMIFESDFLGCEDGWRKYRESCYYVPGNANANRKTWYEAEAICEDLGGTLATVEDRAESDFIYAMLRENNDLNHLWIGLNDFGHKNWWKDWVDGTPVTFTRWDRNQPKQRSGESCVLAYRASFLYSTNDCDRNTNYICERPVKPTNHHEVEEGCRVGWYSFGDRCYLFAMQQNIWFWAQNDCRENGGELVTIFNEDVNAFVHAKVQEISHESDHVSIKK